LEAHVNSKRKREHSRKRVTCAAVRKGKKKETEAQKKADFKDASTAKQSRIKIRRMFRTWPKI